ncbi:Pumilio RNA-binding repeat [Kalmanozyma brasiliensis GHG001]|uniref:Pumilio RNA-binding repeat n=1 Tax=Kalmanozyma brasiliensis (strain GHG001) TaxID=1365824 RepID=UPI001CE9FAA7|nr:Pumilio RNA-binding repeat [Kalmanozyma brasiliensis GHG001]EST08275.2 Pumilio RNA-binding repeat [Kalmanozyma brasiliensis GHG001]
MAPMTPQHQRFASVSSGTCSEDRHVPASDPGSDLSSDYSDLFQASHQPGGFAYPYRAREQMSIHPPCFDPQQTTLPDYVVDELKRLKLENMALKRMAQEVVRINIDSSSVGDSIGSALRCSHHPPVPSPPRLQRVFDGADPTQVFSDASSTNAAPSQSTKVRESGASASMWAPANRGTPVQSGTAAITMGARPFRASEISAAELSRRVAMNDSSAITGNNSPFDATAPAFTRSTPLSRASPRDSPGPATLTLSSRLENAPASSLVTMILEKRGQDASLLLQQQLKSGTPERQAEIMDAICARIVPLSHDRHGNFLVQGAIETRPETAKHLKGAYVELAMSQFGCHVVQKALEGAEVVREAVAEELLGSRLDQTLTSRHSIHVWQRILETEWTRPRFREQIFASINRQLQGRWARTARQETGSIICQNIFESAQPAEKAQCMQEVLEELDECANNQWGVWVVQHIIEHGADDERRAALQGLVRSASKLTLSQYGQKAIMSGLKTGDQRFLQEYVEAMCHSSPPPRPALIDVCLATHGIQIVTQLLTTVDQKTRDRIISTVRRNSVFLKGSKAGMKVHQLCERARAFAGY